MSLTATAEHKSFDPVPEGVHVAVCYLVCDLGTHFDNRFGKAKHEVRIGWEIPGERIDIEKDGSPVSRPRVISQAFTLSLGDKANLRKALEAWRGRAFTPEEKAGFDLRNVLGKACQLQVVHRTKNDKTYANIGAIMSLPRGVPAPEPENDLVWYAMEEGMDIPEGVYEWVAEKIKESDEWKQHVNGDTANHGAEPEPEDDGGEPIDFEQVPF